MLEVPHGEAAGVKVGTVEDKRLSEKFAKAVQLASHMLYPASTVVDSVRSSPCACVHTPGVGCQCIRDTLLHDHTVFFSIASTG